jgi:hypothetical protein
MRSITRGERIWARDSRGRTHDQIAVSGATPGRDFVVAWACRPEEYAAAIDGERLPDAVWWPAEDVEPL